MDDNGTFNVAADLCNTDNLRDYLSIRRQVRMMDTSWTLTPQEILHLDPIERFRYAQRCANWNNLITANTPQIDLAKKMLSRLGRVSTGGPDAQAIMLVTGGADAGKSTLVLSAAVDAHFHHQLVDGAETDSGDPTAPVVKLAARGSSQKSRGYLADWRHAIGDPNWRQHIGAAEQLIDLLTTLRTRLIIIEDAHRLDSGTRMGNGDIWDTLTMIAKRVDAAIILEWTTEDAESLLRCGADTKIAQLARRFKDFHIHVKAMPRPRFDPRTGEMRAGPFGAVLKTFEQRLALSGIRPRDLTNRTVAETLYEHSGGYFGPLTRILVQAADDAIMGLKDRITIDEIKECIGGSTPKTGERGSPFGVFAGQTS